MPVLRTLGT